MSGLFKRILPLLLITLSYSICSPANGQKTPDRVVVLFANGLDISHLRAYLAENPEASLHDFQNVSLFMLPPASDANANPNAMVLSLMGDSSDNLVDRAIAKKVPVSLVSTGNVTEGALSISYSGLDGSLPEANAKELVGIKPDFLLGGGRNHFDPRKRSDGENLLDPWRNNGYKVKSRLKNNTKRLGMDPMVILPEEYMIEPEYTAEDEFLSRAWTGVQFRVPLGGKGLCIMESAHIQKAAMAKDWNYLKGEIKELDKTAAAMKSYAESTPGTLVLILSLSSPGAVNFDGLTQKGKAKVQFSGTAVRPSVTPLMAFGTGSEAFGGFVSFEELKTFLNGLYR